MSRDVLPESWEFSNLVISNLHAGSLFCALLHPFALLHPVALFCRLTFALFCALLRLTAFRTTMFGSCRERLWQNSFCCSNKNQPPTSIVPAWRRCRGPTPRACNECPMFIPWSEAFGKSRMVYYPCEFQFEPQSPHRQQN